MKDGRRREGRRTARVRTRVRAWGLAVVAASVLFLLAGAWAQETPCTYDACALRLKTRLFGTTMIVRGIADEPVSSFGLVLGGSVPLIWESVETVRSRDRLSRAIWWYNRSLDAKP